jgi:hypothetical protein
MQKLRDSHVVAKSILNEAQYLLLAAVTGPQFLDDVAL